MHNNALLKANDPAILDNLRRWLYCIKYWIFQSLLHPGNLKSQVIVLHFQHRGLSANIRPFVGVFHSNMTFQDEVMNVALSCFFTPAIYQKIISFNQPVTYIYIYISLHVLHAEKKMHLRNQVRALHLVLLTFYGVAH